MQNQFRASRPNGVQRTDPAEAIANIRYHLEALSEATMDRAPQLASDNLARSIMSARALRGKHFAASLFSDPAWDLLLELYALEREGQRASVSKLCVSAAVPATTVIRWIDKLSSDGLVVRSEDQLDRRRVWVSLSRSGFDAMTQYLEEVSSVSLHRANHAPFVVSSQHNR